MCGICQQALLDDDCGQEFASITFDANLTANTIPGDTTTTETIEFGETRLESLEVAGDTDWYAIELEAGDAFVIDVMGVDHDGGNGLDALADSTLRLYDSEGNMIASNDNIGLRNKDSQIETAVAADGVYYIEVGSAEDSFAGDYQLDVTQFEIPEGATPLDAIRGNKQLDDSETILVYFAVEGDTYRSFLDVYTATGTNAYEQDQLFSIFEGIEEFADIDFEITTDREAADLEIATAELPSDPSGTLLGFFNFPTKDGEGRFGVLNNNNPDFPEWNDTPGGTLDTGGFMFGVAIHEFGHGLGLGHPHDTGNGSDKMVGVSDSADSGPYNLNMAAYTAMSYVEGSDVAGVADSTAATGHGATFGALDIAVLQEYYGVNTTHASGNDVYILHDSNDVGSGAGYYTTWDTGGTDEIRYEGSKDATIDLRAATLEYELGGGGFVSYVDGVIAGRTIANGVVIENARGGAGNDMITGNAAENAMTGNSGDDGLNGMEGDDRVGGGGGNDDLDGGMDNDVVVGGGGKDTVTGGEGDDMVKGSRGADVVGGGTGNDTVKGGGGNDTFVFTGGVDVWADYNATSDQERIDLSAIEEFTGYTDLLFNHMTQDGNNTVIDDGDGNVLTLRNVNLNEIDPFEFIFAT